MQLVPKPTGVPYSDFERASDCVTSFFQLVSQFYQHNVQALPDAILQPVFKMAVHALAYKVTRAILLFLICFFLLAHVLSQSRNEVLSQQRLAYYKTWSQSRDHR